MNTGDRSKRPASDDGTAASGNDEGGLAAQVAKLEEVFAAHAQQQKEKLEELSAHAQQQKEDAQQQKEKNDQILSELADLRQSKTGKGATTQAQFYQDLENNHWIENKTEEIGSFLGLPSGIIDLPEAVTPRVFDEGTAEAQVQLEFERCLCQIRDTEDIKAQLKSIPRQDAWKRPSFAGRRPDLVNQEKDCTGSIAITFFGDCKRRGNNDFTDEEKGHILDMARVFMDKVGHYRQRLVTFLTDGKRWQFFIAKRSSDGGRIIYEASKVLEDTKQGWNVFWTLLQVNPSALGYKEPKVEGVVLKDPLGRGGSSMVYQGTHGGQDVVVKIFRADKASSFLAEESALRSLEGFPGVPRICHVGTVTDHHSFGIHPQAIILAPVAKKLRTDKCTEGLPVNGAHLKRLVEIVEEAHRKKLVHRDIKPENAFLIDDQLILNDWGSSIDGTTWPPSEWQGTVGYSVSTSQQKAMNWTGEVCDLVALVRTAYVLTCKESPPADGEGATKHWVDRIRPGTVWYQALDFALARKYKELGDHLETLK